MDRDQPFPETVLVNDGQNQVILLTLLAVDAFVPSRTFLGQGLGMVDQLSDCFWAKALNSLRGIFRTKSTNYSSIFPVRKGR